MQIATALGQKQKIQYAHTVFIFFIKLIFFYSAYKALIKIEIFGSAGLVSLMFVTFQINDEFLGLVGGWTN